MRPSDDARALDDLLRARAEGEAPEPVGLGEPSPPSLAPLLRAADRLAVGRAIEPSPDFTRDLTRRLDAQVDAQLGASLVAGASVRARAQRTTTRGVLPRAAFIAAAVAIAVGASLLTVAHSSAPASPLYGLRRFEQHVRANIALSPQDRLSLHLLYAEQALDSAQQAVREQDLPAYRDALATMLDEDDAASRGADALPTYTERDHARAGVEALLQRERTALRDALAVLGWHDRIVTTAALGRIGASGPAITSVLVSTESAGGATIWRVTIGGAGFQPGALLLVNDQPRGTVDTVSDDTLVASVLDGPVPASATIGVGNPDGTATFTTRVTFASVDGSIQLTPTPSATPSVMPTFTPVPTATPDGSHSNNGKSGSGGTQVGINGGPIHGHRRIHSS
jgi:hypothetical protein